MSFNRDIDSDINDTNKTLLEIDNLNISDVSWLGHNGKGGKIDYLLLKGSSKNDLSEKSGRKLSAVNSHIYHLRKEHGLNVINTMGMFKIVKKIVNWGYTDPLKSYYKKNQLSKKAYYLCDTNNLKTTHDLISYFNKCQSFMGLKYANKELDDELVTFYSSLPSGELKRNFVKETISPGSDSKTYSTEESPKIVQNDSTTENESFKLIYLMEKKIISVRAYNACRKAGIENSNELLNYYKNYGTFSKFENCGEKCNLEIIDLCNKLSPGFKNPESILEKSQKEVIAEVLETIDKPLIKKSPKEMITEVLKSSDKPLMAKKISYQIFKNYNGYRMSRFMVRDILWKEMRGLFEYDTECYSYSLSTEYLEQISKAVKRDFENSEIEKNNELETAIKIIGDEIEKKTFLEFVYGIKDDNIDPLIYPYVYNISEIQVIRESFMYWHDRIIKYNIVPSIYSQDYKDLSELILENEGSIDDIRVFYVLIKEVEKKNEKLSKSDQYNLLKENLSDPFHYLLVQLDLQQERNTIHFNNKKFQDLFEEAARDNVITNAEEEYLIEKAKEYDVSAIELMNAIETIDFKAYKSFKLLVDEICEDGIVTDNERIYINEKAKHYNIPQNQLARMIKSGLFKVKLLDRYKKEKVFYDYSKSLFLLKSLDLKFNNDFFLIGENDMASMLHLLIMETKSNIREISIKLNELYKFDSVFDDIDSIYKAFELTPLPLEAALELKKRKHFITSSRKIVETKIKIEGYEYEIKWIDVNKKPLYSVEYINSTHVIKLNLAHWFFQDKNESEKKIIEKMLLALVSTKSDYTNSVLDSFMNKLVAKTELLKYEY